MENSLTKRKLVPENPAAFYAAVTNMRLIVMFVWRRSAKMVLQYILSCLNVLYSVDHIEQTLIIAR